MNKHKWWHELWDKENYLIERKIGKTAKEVWAKRCKFCGQLSDYYSAEAFERKRKVQ